MRQPPSPESEGFRRKCEAKTVERHGFWLEREVHTVRGDCFRHECGAQTVEHDAFSLECEAQTVERHRVRVEREGQSVAHRCQSTVLLALGERRVGLRARFATLRGSRVRVGAWKAALRGRKFEAGRAEHRPWRLAIDSPTLEHEAFCLVFRLQTAARQSIRSV